MKKAKKMKCSKKIIHKQYFQVSNLCGSSFLSYLPKRATRFYRASHGNEMSMFLRLTPIAGFHWHIIIKTIQKIKTRIKEAKQDECSNSLAKIQVCAMFRAGDIRRNVLLKHGDAMFVALWGAQMWRPEANKNVYHRVCYKKLVVVFWGLINIYMSTYSHTSSVRIAKDVFKTCFTAFSAAVLISCHAKA